MSVVIYSERKEMKESAHIVNNEFEAMSVGFVFSQYAKRPVKWSK